jgi:predicted transcriptional regulator
MSRTLTMVLPDDVYDAVEQFAKRTGRPIEAVAVEGVTRLVARPPAARAAAVVNSEDVAAARDRLRKFFGALGPCDPRIGDNDRIDEELAREYSAADRREA